MNRYTILKQLELDEGYRRFPYFDCCGKPFRQCKCEKQGKLTIGIGRNLEDVGLHKEEADYLCLNDIDATHVKLAGRFPWYKLFNTARQNALINMAFNLGFAGFLKFRKTILALEAKKYRQAKIEMLDSKWAGQVERRAIRIANTIESGLE